MRWISSRLKRRLQGTTAYYVLGELRRALSSLDRLDRRFVSLQPQGAPRGNVLLSFINDPFFLKPGEPVSIAHTHDWESLEMANAFLELGYAVDVIRYNNTSFHPQKDYAFFIDTRYNMERMASLLSSDCLRIMHIDTAHCLFQNAAESRRVLELQQRRGVSINPIRHMQHNYSIEHAHCATVLGNEFTMSTFRYAKKPLYRVPISSPVVYPWPEDKDFDAVRRNFFWFGSGGLVHKGLDRVLEAFADLPEYRLTVCGPLGKSNRFEADFEQAFKKELYETPNIRTYGWIDIGSRDFVEIANSCVGLVYPTCSEGGGGSVLTCMHAGMIPLVSYEASVDVDASYGVVLSDCSVSEIKQSVRALSTLPALELERMARRAWEFARARHTKETFARGYRQAIAQIMKDFGRA